MLRIFLTADDHLGLRYSSHERASELAAARLTAFTGMVEAANAAGCALFAIAGDLFESRRAPGSAALDALGRALADFNGTVAILPGNHDWYAPDARLWQDLAALAARADNILLLTEPAPRELDLGGEAAIIYPAPCLAAHSAPGENGLGWIKAAGVERSGPLRIGMAHGSVAGETIDAEGVYFPMTRAELEAVPVDVWLLGHTHVPFPQLTEEFAPAGRIFNAGTHVQTDVACGTEGQCFIVEIGDDRRVRARKFVSGTLRFHRCELKLEPERMERQLAAALAGFGDNSVVDLVLSGAVTAGEYERRAEVLDRLLARFVEGRYSDWALSRLISKELIDAEFPETGFAAALLTELLDEPKEAQMAYDLLRSLEEARK